MKQKITMLILFIGLNTIAQIKFEKGYFISNDGVKTEGFIKNSDWLDNPTYFIFKKDKNSSASTKSIVNIKEFGIYNESQYVRATVNIDKSSNNSNRLSKKRIAEYIEETLFLKVIVKGPANLYFYQTSKFDGLRLFYNLENDSIIKQLEYKKYEIKVDGKKRIGTNNNYQKQLRDYISCGNLKTNRVRYSRKSLIKYFLNYNKCVDINYTQNEHLSLDKYLENTKLILNFKIKLSANQTTLKANRLIGPQRVINFGAKTNPGFGFETELVLPYNKNKWSLFIDPSYSKYSSSKEYVYNSVPGVGDQKTIANFNYDYIEIPIGLRHYFFLNKNSKIFVNLAYVMDFSSNTKLDNEYFNLVDLENFQADNTISYGLGYSFKNKLSVEIRYSNKELFKNYRYWTSDYKNISFIFGYTIF